MTRPGTFLVLLAAVFVAAACAPTGSSSAPGSGLPGSSGAGSSDATGSAAACPTSVPAGLPAGEKRIVTIETAKGKIEITVEANLAPIATANFVALASCGFYDGVNFHRLVPGFVIQGGDPNGTGSGGPGYTFEDEPVVGDYVRGAVAMANGGPDTNGSQFFIILDDLTGRLDKDYSLFGHVTSGMDVVEAIAAMQNAGPPNNEAIEPVAMDRVTVSTP
ncbi:MAG TPA: peptidylprolyl isomerase [Candidatus Limnocylindrales bacterium]|nr:peptidylprolyl isomerase [Candidatus Limnocylindrales bacterium]